MRPRSVKRFELLFLLSLGLGVILSALTWQQSIQMAGVRFVLIVQTLVFGIMLVLVFLISRMGSNIARWVLVILFVIGIVFYSPTLVETLMQKSVVSVLSSVQLMLQVAAMYFIFRPDAKSWFQRA